jgi:uncharacterized OB-fold protein
VSEVHRPVPVPDEVSAPYWKAAAAHQLVLARCAACGACSLPPSAVCPACHSTSPEWRWEQVDGAGFVRSWTTMRSSFLPGFDDEVPFVLVDVELDAQPGLRMIGRLLDGPESPLGLGSRVALGFEDVAEGVAVPAFVLAGAQ